MRGAFLATTETTTPAISAVSGIRRFGCRPSLSFKVTREARPKLAQQPQENYLGLRIELVRAVAASIRSRSARTRVGPGVGKPFGFNGHGWVTRSQTEALRRYHDCASFKESELLANRAQSGIPVSQNVLRGFAFSVRPARWLGKLHRLLKSFSRQIRLPLLQPNAGEEVLACGEVQPRRGVGRLGLE